MKERQTLILEGGLVAGGLPIIQWFDFGDLTEIASKRDRRLRGVMMILRPQA